MLKERELEQYEIYKASFELSSDPKFVLSDGKITKANLAAIAMLDTTVLDIMGKPLHIFLDSYKEHGINALDSLVEKQSIIDSVSFSDGTKRILTIRGTLLNIGTPKLFITIRDISDLTELKELTEIQNNILNNVANGIVLTNRDGEVLWCNSAFSQFTGFEFSEIKGQKTNFLRSGAHPKSFYEKMWEAILQGNTWSDTIINKKKNGEVYEELLTIIPLKRSSHEITGFLAIVQDSLTQKLINKQYHHIFSTLDYSYLSGELDRPGIKILEVNDIGRETFELEADCEGTRVQTNTPWMEICRHIASSGGQVTTEFKLKKKIYKATVFSPTSGRFIMIAVPGCS